MQNLLALRFGNSIFEPLWRNYRIDDVQITIAEDLGVEGRAAFYDDTGALRDMVQNHLLQLLVIIAMEPPVSIDPDAVRDGVAVFRRDDAADFSEFLVGANDDGERTREEVDVDGTRGQHAMRVAVFDQCE